MSDRIAGAVVMALALWYGLTAGQYTAGFSDPLGPAAFPQLVSIPLGLLGLFLVIRPDALPRWPEGAALLRQAIGLVLLVLYAMTLEGLGFLIATALAIALIARLLGARWWQGAVAGVALSLLLWLTFDELLGLPLPLGLLARARV
jgi:putative tricarboxylic transport membrane protein